MSELGVTTCLFRKVTGEGYIWHQQLWLVPFQTQDLENAKELHPVQDWRDTYTKQGAKALNNKVQQALEKTIDLRSLTQEPPKENAQECLRLMGMALKNLSKAMNNTQALEAAAIILGSEPTPQAIAYRAKQLEMLPQAVSDIRRVLAQPACTWQEFLGSSARV
ncbi:hypothetical protein [Nostoc sp. UHCC 0926]|uniref:hypothetical protein n=1 Tax=Nostoc sp. UHCC 0926 TaxID=3025190 RepID=UPI003081385C